MKKISLIMAMVLTVISLTACGGNSKLIGQWSEKENSDTVCYEFFKSGKYKYVHDYGEGTYRMEDSDRLILTDFYGATKDYRFEIKNNVLTLNDKMYYKIK